MITPIEDGWLRVLREFQPIASAGYANPAKQTFYDSFLKRAGLTWAEVAHSRDDLRGGLVEAQALEARMAQAAGAGPLGEADLADELRLDPGRVAEARRVDERGVLAAQRLEPLGQVAQGRAVEAGPDLARVAQRRPPS